MYYLSVNIWVRALGPCLLLLVRVTKQHAVNISFLKKLVQRIIEALHLHSKPFRLQSIVVIQEKVSSNLKHNTQSQSLTVYS